MRRAVLHILYGIAFVLMSGCIAGKLSKIEKIPGALGMTSDLMTFGAVSRAKKRQQSEMSKDLLESINKKLSKVNGASGRASVGCEIR